MISYIISRTVIMVFGTLYPAYASYKAVRSRNVREYVKWMMYWIVFAIFSCIETFTDIFLSWFPFYYELKILMVIWLLAPATKGSSILYRKFVHPTLSSKEQEIDEYITKAKEQSYKQVLDLGTRGVSAIMQTAIKSGGGLVNQIKKSYSLSDLTDCNMDEQDGGEIIEREQPRLSRHSRPRRAGGPSSNTTSTNAAMYYSQLDIRADSLNSIPSEDLSSGYSSGDANLAALHQQQQQTLGRSRGESLQRTASLTRAKPTRVTRSTGVTIVRKGSTTTTEDVSEARTETESASSASDEDFQDTLDGNAGENGSYVPSASALANHGIVMTQSLENSVLSPSNNTPLNNNADSATISPFVSLGEVDNNISVQTGDSVQHHDIINKVEDERVNTVRSKLEEITNVLEDIESLKSQFDLEDTRAGKYHKRHAPAIPEASAITAKLVLKPGVLKPLTNPEDYSVSQVFCHSPKFRRRSRGGSSKSLSGSCSRSRSRSSSPCPPPTKTDTSLMKLAVLQKKLFGKDGKMNDLFHPNKRDHQHDNDLD